MSPRLGVWLLSLILLAPYSALGNISCPSAWAKLGPGAAVRNERLSLQGARSRVITDGLKDSSPAARERLMTRVDEEINSRSRALRTAIQAGRPEAKQFDVVIVGGGIHGSVVASSLPAHLKVLVVEEHPQVLGYFRSFGRSFRINSPELPQGSANYLPNGRVQLRDLSPNRRFAEAEDLGNAAGLNLYASAAEVLTGTRVTKIHAEGAGPARLELAGVGEIESQAVVVATGLGSPKIAIKNPEAATLLRLGSEAADGFPVREAPAVMIFDQAMARAHQAKRAGIGFQTLYQGDEVAVVGGGDSANVIVEALTGGPGGPAKIHWYRQKAANAAEFREANAERYHESVSGLFDRPDLLAPVPEYVEGVRQVTVNGKVRFEVTHLLPNGETETRLVDKILLATGYESGVADLLGAAGELRQVRGPASGIGSNTVLGQQFVGEDGPLAVFVAGPAAGAMATAEELARTITKNQVSINVTAPRSAGLAERLRLMEPGGSPPFCPLQSCLLQP
jgi:hypothetical protein